MSSLGNEAANSTDPRQWDDEELLRRLSGFELYHSIKLNDRVTTSGIANYHSIQQPVLDRMNDIDFKDKRVLDVGCRDGLFAIEAEQRGASDVLAFDNCLSKAAVEVLLPYLGSKIRMLELNLYNLSSQEYGKFDIILFPGVLYHLRYPFWALRILAELLNDGGVMILETGVMLNEPDLAMLFCPTGDDSPYEPTSVTFFNPKGLFETLHSLNFTTSNPGLLFHPEGLQNECRLGWKDRIKRALGRTPDRIIDRLTVVCTRRSESDASNDMNSVGAYWNATHEME